MENLNLKIAIPIIISVAALGLAGYTLYRSIAKESTDNNEEQVVAD